MCNKNESYNLKNKHYNFRIVDKYFKYCHELKIKPSWDGLDNFIESLNK